MTSMYILTFKWILAIKHIIPSLYFTEPNKLNKREYQGKKLDYHLEGKVIYSQKADEGRELVGVEKGRD